MPDTFLPPSALTEVFDHISNGVTIADATQEDMPLVYANRTFETVTGYGSDDVIGRNCRFLQGSDTDNEAVETIRHICNRRTKLGDSQLCRRD
ncbi:MAG: PAS domain-containing protein, partial [Acidobacteriota bacterium]